MSKTPVYFLSHGGPNIMYDTKHPVYPRLTTIGDEITNKVNPKAVVVVSAHWESSTRDVIEINAAEKTDLIYDFYGFPKHYYEHKYPSIGSSALASQLATLLTEEGIKSKSVKRGLDHGVFASFSILFPPSSTNALFPNIPLVQISLPSPTSPDSSRYISLGRALSPLRSQGVVIICSGMAVHNLRDLFSNPDPSKPLNYAITFDEALRSAVEDGGVEERAERMGLLLQRKDAKRAHPSWDHLWPVFVATGAGEGDAGKRIWTLVEGSMSWGMFRFGGV